MKDAPQMLMVKLQMFMFFKAARFLIISVCVQLVLILSQLQTAIINILAMNGTIACAPPFSSKARGYSKLTTVYPRGSNVHHVTLPALICLHSAESAAADPGDVHHHAGDASAVPPTVRAATRGGLR